MPIYEYRRPDGSTFEVLQGFTDDPLERDPETGVPVERVLHAPAVHFKGKGFYNTDYGTRKRQREKTASGEGASSDNGSGAEKSSGDSGSNGSGGSTGSAGSAGSAGSSDSSSKGSSEKASGAQAKSEKAAS